MNKREDEMQEPTYNPEGQLVKAVIFLMKESSEHLARAEAAEKERDNLGDSLRNYAELERIANERAEAAEKRVKTLETAIEDYLENWEDEGIAKRFRVALEAKLT